MPVEAEIGLAEIGNTVPYPPDNDRGRTNAGFVDLRGRPALVDQIHEARNSKALARFLRSIATSDYWMSMGCDLGTRIERQRGRTWQMAGGYVQFASTDFTADFGLYELVAERLSDSLGEASGDRDWRVRFAIQSVCYKLESADPTIGSLSVWFDAGAATLEDAVADREGLLDALNQSLLASSEIRDLLMECAE